MLEKVTPMHLAIGTAMDVANINILNEFKIANYFNEDKPATPAVYISTEIFLKELKKFGYVIIRES